jgi:phosphatidylinositol alpha 1,6-mannosyltransferase
MRIAFLTPVYPPMVSGASLVIQRLSDGMAARGHEVLVLTSSDRPAPYRNAKSNLTVIRLSSFRNPLRVGQRLAFWPYREVIKTLKEFTPDVLHVSDPIQFAMPGLHYSHGKKIPGIYSIQQLPWFLSSYLPNVPGLKYALEKTLWMYGKWLTRQFDAITTPTRTIAKIVEEKTGITPYAISNGVDLDLFKPNKSCNKFDIAFKQGLGIPTDVPIILHVGRLDIDKQVDVAIRACARAMEQTNAHLLIVGDGQERSRLTQLCAELGIGQRSHFTGFISYADGLADIYRLAKVFVMSSQIETQGIVLLEASASGIPIVAINATCIPEVVVHNSNGYLVQPGCIKDMGDYIIQLIQNPSCAIEMGRSGRKMVQNHSIQKALESYENLLIKCHAEGGNRKQYKAINQKARREYSKS